jgi:predicted phosphodiesterase
MAEETWVVLSDIHSNLEAFQAVLADMRTIRFERMICLGDVAGYAASPKDCLDLLRTLEIEVLQGNHDFAVIDDAILLDMSGAAVASIRYAREQLSPSRRDFLAALPLVAGHGEMQFVHSSLDHPEAMDLPPARARDSRAFRNSNRSHLFLRSHPHSRCLPP